jgi:uncharacterized protein YhfF
VALILKENMKHIAIILFLIFISCKNESKTKSETQTETESENVIDKSVSEMWNNYIASNPEFKDEEIPEFDFFHNNKEDAHRLAELTINGKKKASSGLFSLYKKYNVDLPKVGTKKIITNFNGKEKAIIENKSVDTIPFNKISQDYAELDMGTEIEALKKWKKAHWDFFESFLEEIGEQPTEKMLIVCVRFETIWTEK